MTTNGHILKMQSKKKSEPTKDQEMCFYSVKAIALPEHLDQREFISLCGAQRDARGARGSKFGDGEGDVLQGGSSLGGGESLDGLQSLVTMETAQIQRGSHAFL